MNESYPVFQRSSKPKSLYETYRKKASRAFVAAVIAIAVFTVPKGFENGLHKGMEVFGFLLLIVAALGRVWCTSYIAGRKDKCLCTEGPYSLSRNPLYLFSFVGVIGFSLAVQSVFLCLLTSGVFLAFYHFVIASEERRLACLFGEKFESYQRITPRFFPSLRVPSSCDSIVVSSRIIERGLLEVFWFLAAIIGAEILENVHHSSNMILGILPF